MSPRRDPWIRVRSGWTQSSHPGWRWECLRCGHVGFQRSHRWTDYVLAKKGKVDLHPQQRCIQAADLHTAKHHPELARWPERTRPCRY